MVLFTQIQMEVVSPSTSMDAKTITYLGDYNIDKGYGELFVKTQKEDQEKISSDVKDQTLSSDGSEVYYITNDDILYKYDVSSKKKVKIGNDVENYSVDGNKIVYMNNDKTLYSKVGTKDAEKLSSDTDEFGFLDNEDIYFLTNDKDLFVKNEKVLSDVENLYASGDHFYYLTVDKQIGYYLIGQKSPTILLEDLKSYSSVYAENYLLYQKQLNLSDIKGYWFDSLNERFILFDDIEEDNIQMKIYNKYLEDSIGTMNLYGSSENSMNLNGVIDEQEIEMQIKLINPRTIELIVDGTYQVVFTKSNENSLSKMQGNIVSSDNFKESVDKNNEDKSVNEEKEIKNKEGINDNYVASEQDIKYLVAII